MSSLRSHHVLCRKRRAFIITNVQIYKINRYKRDVSLNDFPLFLFLKVYTSHVATV